MREEDAALRSEWGGAAWVGVVLSVGFLAFWVERPRWGAPEEPTMEEVVVEGPPSCAMKGPWPYADGLDMWIVICPAGALPAVKLDSEKGAE